MLGENIDAKIYVTLYMPKSWLHTCIYKVVFDTQSC